MEDDPPLDFRTAERARRAWLCTEPHFRAILYFLNIYRYVWVSTEGRRCDSREAGLATDVEEMIVWI